MSVAAFLVVINKHHNRPELKSGQVLKPGWDYKQTYTPIRLRRWGILLVDVELRDSENGEMVFKGEFSSLDCDKGGMEEDKESVPYQPPLLQTIRREPPSLIPSELIVNCDHADPGSRFSDHPRNPQGPAHPIIYNPLPIKPGLHFTIS